MTAPPRIPPWRDTTALPPGDALVGAELPEPLEFGA